jgi:hypothetical protein
MFRNISIIETCLKNSEFITIPREKKEELFMNLVKKIGQGLTALALSPFLSFEKKERDRRLEERLKRSEQRRAKT